MTETINADHLAGVQKMTQQALTIVRNAIFVVTLSLATVIITLPSGASDKSLADKLGVFSGLAKTAEYNPALALTQRSPDSGDRYRLDASIPIRDNQFTRSVFSIKFDQKNLIPLAASSKSFSSLKKRNDIAFDHDRSLLADYRLTGK